MYDKNRQHRIDKAKMLIGILELFIKPGRFLEVGPSLGYNMQAAQQRGWKTKGIDISDYAVEYCKRLGLDVENKTLEDLDEKYDAILMKHVLEHYKDPFAALMNVREKLNDGGCVQVLVPNSALKKPEKLRGKHKFYSGNNHSIEHFVYFNKETLHRIMLATGFDIVQEDFPILVAGENTLGSIIDRTLRKSLSLLNIDQEIMIIGKK